MNIETVDEMPIEGQFVAIWFYNDKMWAGTFLWVNEQLFEYNEKEDDFIISTDPAFLSNSTFMVKG